MVIKFCQVTTNGPNNLKINDEAEGILVLKNKKIEMKSLSGSEVYIDMDQEVIKEIEINLCGNLLSWCRNGFSWCLKFLNKKDAFEFYSGIVALINQMETCEPIVKKMKKEENLEPSNLEKSLKNTTNDTVFLIPSSPVKSSSSNVGSSRRSSLVSNCSAMGLEEARILLKIDNYSRLILSSEKYLKNVTSEEISYKVCPLETKREIFKLLSLNINRNQIYPSCFIEEHDIYPLFFNIMNPILTTVKTELKLDLEQEKQFLFTSQFEVMPITKEQFCNCHQSCAGCDDCRFKAFGCKNFTGQIGAKPDFVFKVGQTVPLLIEARNCCSSGGLKQTMLYLTCVYKKQSLTGNQNPVYGFSTTGDLWIFVRYDGTDFKLSKQVELLYPSMVKEENEWIKNNTEVIDIIYSIVLTKCNLFFNQSIAF